MLVPRQPVPDLVLDTVTHGRFDLAAEASDRGTMICVYRGLHCPICATYLRGLEKLVPEFEKRGYGTIAVSSDDAERARAFADKIGAEKLRIGYGMPIEEARRWGLYISTGIGKTSAGVEEPPLFPEPGLFIVNADRTLYCASIQTMPFARPHFEDVLQALDFIIARDYPARGEWVEAA